MRELNRFEAAKQKFDLVATDLIEQFERSPSDVKECNDLITDLQSAAASTRESDLDEDSEAMKSWVDADEFRRFAEACDRLVRHLKERKANK